MRIVYLFLALMLFMPLQAQQGEIRLLVRGDDIGSSQAANQACINSYRNGIMRSVELMVPCPWFLDAARLLKENPGLDVGIHLVLNSEWAAMKWRPLTCAPSLVDSNGYFYPMVWQTMPLVQIHRCKKRNGICARQNKNLGHRLRWPLSMCQILPTLAGIWGLRVCQPIYASW